MPCFGSLRRAQSVIRLVNESPDERPIQSPRPYSSSPTPRSLQSSAMSLLQSAETSEDEVVSCQPVGGKKPRGSRLTCRDQSVVEASNESLDEPQVQSPRPLLSVSQPETWSLPSSGAVLSSQSSIALPPVFPPSRRKVLPPLKAIPTVTLSSPCVAQPELQTLQTSGPAFSVTRSLLAACTFPPVFRRSRRNLLPPLTNPPAIPPVTLPSPCVTRPEMRTLQSSGPAVSSQSLLAADTLPAVFPRMRGPGLPPLTNLPAIPHVTLPRPNVTQPETASLRPSGPARSLLRSWLVADTLPPMFSRARRGVLPPLNCRPTFPLVSRSPLSSCVSPHTHRVMLAVLDMVNDPSHHTPSDSPVTSPCCSSPETPTLHLSASACLVEQSDALVCVSPLSSAVSDLPPSGLNHGGMALVQQQLFVAFFAVAKFGTYYLR